MLDLLPCRTVAEAHLYLDLLGWPREGREHHLEERGGVWIAVYEVTLDGEVQRLSFQAPDDPLAHQEALGGAESSRLVDPGQFLAHGARLAGSVPLNPEDVDPGWRPIGARRLELAARCIDEVLKFIPPGTDRVPPDRFWTAEGQAARQQEPARFERDRLEAVARAFRDIASRYAATPEAAVRAYLRPSGWDGVGQAIARRLLPLPGAPIVAYGWDPLPLRAYVGAETLKQLGMTAEQVHAQAVARLERQPPPYRISDLSLPGDPPLRVAVVEGEYAAEQVLVPDYLTGLARELGAEGAFAVAVPFRGLLLAADLGDSGALLRLAERLHAEPRGEAISDWVLVVHEGVPQGRARPR